MKKRLSIIGAGPASLMLAAFLDPTQFEVTIFEKNKAAGRKFLVAGKGGFNLTHSEDINTFVKKYAPDSFLVKALLRFSNEDLREWLDRIGIPTFVGTSKRVYPEASIKPIAVLQKIMSVLKHKSVQLRYQQEWTGWGDAGQLLFINRENGERYELQSDIVVFALGGGSWKVTGSDGCWLETFTNRGILTKDFRASNCAFEVKWPALFIKQYSGVPLKNIAINCGGNIQKGEVVITDFGLEGNAIYALSMDVQEQLHNNNSAKIFIDLKPMFSAEEILTKLQRITAKNISDALRKSLKLNKVQLALLKCLLSKETFTDLKRLSAAIKQLPVNIHAAAPLDEAISTTGGIDLSALTENYELKKMVNTFCIGEMLDWNAPTGGYLLQACFTMGHQLARYLNSNLSDFPDRQ